MVKAAYEEKDIVTDILLNAFNANSGVSFFIQEASTSNEFSQLISDAFEECYHFGEVFISDNKKACALILFPDKDHSNAQSLLQDITLVFQSVHGFSNLKKILSGERTYSIDSKIPVSYQNIIEVALDTGFLVFNSLIIKHLILKSTWSIKEPLLSSTSDESLTPDAESAKFNQFESNCKFFNLSPQEIEVAKQQCLGFKRRNIAVKLTISVKTLDNHFYTICKKIGIKKTKNSHSRRAQLIQRLGYPT